jgi:DNA-binding CsgD family transcriptional regulator
VGRLRASELEGVLAFLADAEAVRGHEPFTTELLDRLKLLVPCTLANFWDYDLAARRVISYVPCSDDEPAPAGVSLSGDEWALIEGSSDRVRQRQTGDHGVVMLSDEHRRRVRIRYEGYSCADVFRAAGVLDTATVTLAPALAATSMIVIRLYSDGRDFTERDRAVLSVLQPHLRSLYGRARLRLRLGATRDGPARAPASCLTARERDVVRCVAAGRSDVQIAEFLAISPRTVGKHLEHVYGKLRVSGRTAALAALGLSGADGLDES